MCPGDERQHGSGAEEPSADERLASLERQMAALAAEVAALRESARARPETEVAPEPRAAPPSAPHVRNVAPSGPMPSGWSAASRRARLALHSAASGEELESLVGRYGTLLLAALVILMGVGVLIERAVAAGLLTPVVRVGFGALAAGVVGAAGVLFHRKGEIRFGNVLLALALAMVDLVAWGAGPRLHLVPTSAALVAVDVVAVALAALAVHDESEFLFTVAVAGALSAPFVTAERPGSATLLLAYGAGVLLGALRSARDPGWLRAFAVMVGAALFYELAAAGLPAVQGWHGPFLLVLFAGTCALGALLLAEPEWRGTLSRAYLAVGVLGLPVGWDRMLTAPPAVTLSVAAALAAVTYAALAERPPREHLWLPSALALPALSLGIASTAASGDRGRAAVLAGWAALALGAWRMERRRGMHARASAHLLVGGVLGGGAVARLLWPFPLALVAGLAGWGVLLCLAAREEEDPHALVAVTLVLGAAAAAAVDQLASRTTYGYVPFTTRSSASALCAMAGLAGGAALLARGRGRAVEWVARPARLGAVVGFAILWGRMEMAGAFNRDLATFLLTAYYAACGVASIIVGRRMGVQRLRLAGLALATYAAVKAVVEASAIGALALRVGVYGAVGFFLLGAGYLYRERGGRREAGEGSPLLHAE